MFYHQFCQHQTHLRNDVNLLSFSFCSNIIGQYLCPVLNWTIRRHCSSNHFDPFHRQSMLDAVPILDGWEERSCQSDLVEAEEAMSKNQCIFGGFCFYLSQIVLLIESEFPNAYGSLLGYERICPRSACPGWRNAGRLHRRVVVWRIDVMWRAVGSPTCCGLLTSFLGI